MFFAVGAALATAPISTPYFLQHILPSLRERFSEIVSAPFRTPDMLWITLPLLITLVMMEVYFGRYRKEQLGWSTAVGNNLVLVFVSLDLLRQLYGSSGLAGISEVFALYPGKTIIAATVGLSGLLILYYDFFHLLPKRFAFTISSSLAVNLTAYLAIVIIYTSVGLDWYTFFAGLLLFVTAAAFFALVRRVEPKPAERYYVGKAERVISSLFRPLEKEHEKKKGKRKKDVHSS
ncbi:hypothetical protein HYV83_03760 [Candidatus Woesearchaeota archaeon]|nr:hypothetical protein [Candidatus Woesearchaeota archaeon]